MFSARMAAFGHGVAVVGSQGRQPLDEENRTRTASPGRGDRTVRPRVRSMFSARADPPGRVCRPENGPDPDPWTLYAAPSPTAQGRLGGSLALPRSRHFQSAERRIAGPKGQHNVCRGREAPGGASHRLPKARRAGTGIDRSAAVPRAGLGPISGRQAPPRPSPLADHIDLALGVAALLLPGCERIRHTECADYNTSTAHGVCRLRWTIRHTECAGCNRGA